MSDVIVLLVRFVPKPGQLVAFKAGLSDLVASMAIEPDFVSGILHEDLERPGELVFYETWHGTKARWLAEQPSKDYRRHYETTVPELLERRDITWLVPTDTWMERTPG